MRLKMNLEILARNLTESRRLVAEAEKDRLPTDSIYILRCQSQEAWYDYSRALRRGHCNVIPREHSYAEGYQ
jgi:hypothetical protein